MYHTVDPEDEIVKVQASPSKPSFEEVEAHNVTHLPYRSWCPVCVASRGREDPHSKVKSKANGKPVVVMDYKTFGNGLGESADDKIRAIVMRDQTTGMIAGHICESKGPGDRWIVEKLIDDIASWGHTDIVLKTDGEASILALQEKIAEGRTHQTVPENPPAYNPQSNGVAERAVQEFAAQLRSLKLALESRIGVVINRNWQVLNVMASWLSTLATS